MILSALASATKVVAVAALKLDRFGVTDKALQLIEKLNIPFVIMPHDKATISEHHKQYAGFYAGLLSDEGTSAIVEDADLILNIGDALWSDFNTTAFTNNLDLGKVLNLAPLFVEDKRIRITNVYLSELLDVLLSKVAPKNYTPAYAKPILQKLPVTSANLTLKTFYNQLLHFLQASDNLVVETGSSSLNLPKFPLPDGTKYHNQTLWGSIGWATPATLGIALAKPESRAILVTGEGSHQLTLNEIGVMGRYQINPIIFCVNNNGFMVERALELDPNPSYDDLAQLNYAKLPEAFGCKNWLALKVTTEQELADAIEKARKHPYGVYIELVTGEYDYGTALNFYNSHLKEMYGQ
jgi:indolepyruvate decarboxylase